MAALRERLGLVVWGAALPLRLWRALWADVALRRRTLWILGLQLGVTLLAAGGWLWFDGSLERLELTPRRAGRTAAALYAAMVVTQWLVITVSRQHHDAIATGLARRVGVEPDEVMDAPRLTFEVRWVFEMFQRRVQAALVLVASALPVVLLLGVVLVGPQRWAAGHEAEAWRAARWALAQLPNAALLLLSLYWLAVSAVGKSGHVWRDEDAPEWGPLRWVEARASRWPALVGPLRLWARLVRRPMGLMIRPAAVVERAPWESVGLALVQLFTNLPLVRLVLRPVMPVAATLVREVALGHELPQAAGVARPAH